MTRPTLGRPARARGPVRRRLLPKPRIVLATLLILVFVGVLVVQAYINAEFASDHNDSEVGDQSGVPLEIRSGGPVINTTGGQESSSRMPERTIALTFDDGPDPTWTPQILDVLADNGAHGTFFVIGSEVARNPALTKRITDAGNELGLHTFTHPNLQRIAPWRRTLELSQTQVAIARATGVHTNLARFPYSSKPSAIDDVNWKIVKDAGRQGYLIVVNDVDSEDWQRPGVRQIVRNATPPGDTPAVILFHDAGGDRSQTVAALRRFIPMMKARGYRFTTVTEGINQSIAQSNKALGKKATPAPLLPENPPAASSDVWRGAAVIWTVRAADWLVWLIAGLFLVVGLLTIARTAVLLLLASRHARQRRKPGWSWGDPVTAPVSIIVPAYNEKEGIEAAVRSLAGGDYPGIEVVVVDDGSTDGTALLVERLGLPNVRVIRVPNGGKANALNTGIALAKHELIVTVDGDTIFEKDSIRMLVQPFADPTVGAVAGNVKVGNREKMVAAWQHIEYVIGFNLDRRLYELLNCMPTVPGAIGAFRRDGARPGRRDQRRDPGRGHRRHDGAVPGRLAGGLRGAGQGLDRGAGHAGAAVPAAVPVELRDHAGDVEAPPGAARPRAVRPVRAGRAAVPGPVRGGAADAGPGRRHHARLRPGLLGAARDADRLAAACWPCNCSRRRSRSASTGSRCARCGGCRCSSSPTAS